MTAQLSPLARFDNLLLATDGDEVSAGAVRVALHMADRCGAKLTVMHMARTLRDYAMFNPDGVRQAEDEGHAILKEVERQAGTACVNCAPVLRYGEEPVHEIAAQAEESQADVVIMGRRGVHWLERLMLGEAAARVVGHVHCSVLVVPKESGMWDKGILLAVDGSRFADAASVAAANLARRCGLPVTVLSVCANDDLKCEMVQAMADRVRDLLRQEGVAADSVVKEGNPAQAIVAAAAENDCDLIIVGSHGRTGLDRLLMGSVSQQVVIQAKCPVLVAKTT
ncbi:MAG: universal stress protein [Gallionellaceae bacterium]|nr:universal stress protein [Gallionellaceae bacterium]